MIISLEIKNDIVEKRYYKEPTKISVLSSGKIDKYKYVTDEELQLSYQSRIIEQAKFTYSTLGKKPFRKTNKVIEDQEEKEIKEIETRTEKQLLDIDQKSILSLFSKDFLTEEATCISIK